VIVTTGSKKWRKLRMDVAVLNWIVEGGEQEKNKGLRFHFIDLSKKVDQLENKIYELENRLNG
jgi:hypothetical protein